VRMFWYEFNGFLYVEKMFDNFFFPRQNAGDEPRARRVVMPQHVGEGSDALLKPKNQTNEFASNPPFLKTNLVGVISYPTFWWEQLELI
jgi:hypothetical protein